MSKQWWVVGTIVVGMILGAVALVMNSPDSYGVAVGKKAPDFRVVDLETGDTISLREKYAGQVTLVNIWATWCAPCRAEMPSMEVAYQELAPRGFKVAAVSIDDGDPADVIAFGAEMGVTFDLLFDQSGEIQRIYQTTGVPESFLLDRDGVIVKRIIGAHDWSSKINRELIERLLDQAS
ncbi:MAG: TlpA family protein disulfide reductase [Gemmatimonadales bacterium]|jgi:peroxiredoxin|nr:MAG: TlpA family protein disulfide reductase [Gemmatimonadales bacterium]